MTDLLCPVCRQPLSADGKSYRCPSSHTFDIARQGYVNLLLSSSRGRHGDDKLMVNARTRFLEKGFYLPLAEAVAAAVRELSPRVLVDAGCGEGYYTALAAKEVPDAEVFGFDISRDAVAAAARRCPSCTFAVASTAAMPLADGSADGILNLFSPLFAEEFGRILSPGGQLIRVIPLEMHLHELRCAVYDRPYDNDVPAPDLQGFRLLDRQELKYQISLEGPEDIRSLFLMTPYYYKTGRQDQEKLERLSSLTTRIEFGILIYGKA